MARKWNNLGSRQIKMLQLISRVPRSVEYLIERMKRDGTHAEIMLTISRLEKTGFCRVMGDLVTPTDHGKAVIKSPESYKRWRRQWGMS